MRTFIDSDVVISSLLSDSGAAYFLLQSSSKELFISSTSKDEIEEVCKRLNIKSQKLVLLIGKKLKVVKISDMLEKIKNDFRKFVLDENDAHIIAGAVACKADFLLTYNLKDFKIEKIKEELGVIVMTPGSFLQYLRSLD